METKIKSRPKQTNYLRPFDVLDIVLTLLIAYQYISFWLFPSAAEVGIIYSFVILIAFEFVMVHSGVFMAVMPLKYVLFLFFPIYGLFAWAFNTMIDDNTILWLYLIVVLNRVRFAFANKNDEETKNRAIGTSIYAVLIYFFLVVIAAVTADWIPAFGLSTPFLDAAGYYSIADPGGIFTDMPETAMFVGTFYYLFLSAFSILLLVRPYYLAKKRRNNDGHKNRAVVENATGGGV